MTKPDANTIIKWKEQYGSIYIITLEDRDIYIRTLTPSEIMSVRELQDALPDEDWEMIVVKLAVLYPEDLSFELPGSPVALARFIYDKSLPFDPKTAEFNLDEQKEWVEKHADKDPAFGLAVALVNNMPGLNLIELLHMPVDQLLKLAAIYEKITGKSLWNKDNSTKEEEAHKKALREAIAKAKRNTPWQQ